MGSFHIGGREVELSETPSTKRVKRLRDIRMGRWSTKTWIRVLASVAVSFSRLLMLGRARTRRNSYARSFDIRGDTLERAAKSRSR